MKIELKYSQNQKNQIVDFLQKQNLKFEIKKNYLEIFTEIDNSKLQNFINFLVDNGVEVVKENQKFIVQNMTCAACVRTVENTLLDSQGVLKTQVNFANSVAYVEYIPAIFDFQKAQQELIDLSYNILKDKDKQKAEENEILETKKIAKDTIITGILTLPVFVAGMFFHSNLNIQYFSFILTAIIIIFGGNRFFKSAFLLAKKGQSNMYTLISLGVLFSFFVSIFSLFLAKNNLELFHQHIYFEASAVILFFALIGRFIEKKATISTKTSLKELYNLKINKVTRLINNCNEEVNAEQIEIDDILLAKPGEVIAVDGIIEQGNSYIDESTLTGEPIPVFRSEGSRVLAGTVNQNGTFTYRAKNIGKDSVLWQIIETIEQVQSSKSQIQRLADKIASIFVPAVIVIALITFALWYFWGTDNNLISSIMFSVSVLVVACPCALGLATPTALMVGVGKASKNGILIQNPIVFEKADKINTVVFDKTGTLTIGKPQIINFLGSLSSDQINILCSIEAKSEHPLSVAVLDFFKSFTNVSLQEFENIQGKGILAIVNDKKYFVGNKKFLLDYGFQNSEFELIDTKIKVKYSTIVYFASQDSILALFEITDTVKQTSKEVVSKLKSKGYKIFILSGDNKLATSNIASELGINEFFADLMPTDKVEKIKELKQKKNNIVYIGDGLNDAAAMNLSDIGVAMNTGNNITLKMADMSIISSDLIKLPQAIKIAKMTNAKIKQNLFWAFFYNILMIPLAAGVLVPIIGISLNPMIASFAMAFSSFSVVANSLTLKYKKI